MKVWALSLNTFKEAVRDRVLHSILFFAVAAVILSIAFEEITIGDQKKVVRSIAQSGVDLFASIIAIFLGISLVWKEIDKKTIYTILSKPIPRSTFLIGKYSGLVMTVGEEDRHRSMIRSRDAHSFRRADRYLAAFPRIRSIQNGLIERAKIASWPVVDLSRVSKDTERIKHLMDLAWNEHTQRVKRV